MIRPEGMGEGSAARGCGQRAQGAAGCRDGKEGQPEPYSSPLCRHRYRSQTWLFALLYTPVALQGGGLMGRAGDKRLSCGMLITPLLPQKPVPASQSPWWGESWSLVKREVPGAGDVPRLEGLNNPSPTP